MAMRNLDCLLIVPNSRGPAYGPLVDFAAVEPPVWAAMLAGDLRTRRHTVAILDANCLDLSPVAIGNWVSAHDPRLTVIVAYGHQPSASTQTMPAAHAAMAAIRELPKRYPLAILGGHVSSVPDRTLAEEPVDYVIQGSGVRAIKALIRGAKDLFGIIVDQVPDYELDMLVPAWDLLPPLGAYVAHPWHALGWPSRSPYAAVHTTLNCPFSCSFCCISAPFGGPGYRKWSPTVVGQQIAVLFESQSVQHIKIVDEMFWLDERHVEAICDEILQCGIGKHLNLWAYARVDTVRRPSLLDKARRAGFRWLALGIEAADSAVRDGQAKDFCDEKIVQTVETVRNAGIHVIGNYIFGLPGETVESMERTLSLALELRCEWANFYPAMAFPGSRLYAEALAKGTRLPETWAGYAPLGYECVPLPTDTLSSEEILAFRDEAFVRYFTDPNYLGMLRTTFGDQVVDQVQTMTALPIRRKILGH